jgi:hypothetical protein
VKSLVLFGFSAVFLAASAKPFITRPETQAGSWAAYRSYPYAAWADQAVRRHEWQKAADYYAMALQRNPLDTRYAAGVRHAQQKLRRRPLAVDAPIAPAAISWPKYVVRHEIPKDTRARLRPTAWRGPIVTFNTELGQGAAGNKASAAIKPAAEPFVLTLADVPATAPLHAAAPAAPAITTITGSLPGARANVIPAARHSRWSMSSSSTYRSRALPVTPQGAGEFGGSHSGAELRWRLNRDEQRPVQLTAATFVSNTVNGGFRGDSTQAMIGLRYKPFQKTNIVLGADQLVKVGSQSRSALALRVMGDVGSNYDGPENQNRWLHWHAGFDTALIGTASRDLFASAEARTGIGFRLNQTLSLTPYVGIHALHQQAGERQTLVEAGPGLWLRTRLFDTSQLDMRIAYRMSVAGNTETRDGVVVQMALGF